MKRSNWSVLGFVILLVLAATRPSEGYEEIKGPTDLARYCKAAFGSSYVPVQIAAGLDGWRCQSTSTGDRRSMDIQDACERQWNAPRTWIKAIFNGSVWVCAYVFIEQPVNLDTYCKGHFGGQYQAILHGSRSTDWSCQRGSNQSDRKPISVDTACKEQWPYNRFIRSLAVPPTNWTCLMLSAQR